MSAQSRIEVVLIVSQALPDDKTIYRAELGLPPFEPLLPGSLPAWQEGHLVHVSTESNRSSINRPGFA